MPTSHRGIDWSLVLIIGLVVGASLLGSALYLFPAAEGMLTPRWWHWIVLGAAFFTVVGLITYRRKTRSHAELHRVLREDAASQDT